MLSPGHILSILVVTRVPGRKYVLIWFYCTSNNGKVGIGCQNGRVVQLRFSRKRFLGEFVLVGGGVGAAAGAPGASERRRQAGGHLHHLHQGNQQSNHQGFHQNLTGEPVTPQPSRWAEYIFLMSINNEKEWLLCNIQDLVIYAFDFKWFCISLGSIYV